MAKEKTAQPAVTELPAPSEPDAQPWTFPVAILVRPDGPYEAGQAVTVDPNAPWEKGQAPSFVGDEERMKTWRAAGKPIFVDDGRFDVWERDGFFRDSTKKEMPNG